MRDEAVTPEVLTQVTAAIEVSDPAYLAEEIPAAIEQSLDGIARISKIVLAMKEFSHPGGKDKVLVDLNKNIANTVVVASNEWKYIAELVTEFDEQLPLVPCHPQEISQVMLNLVVNAAHAIDDKNGGSSADRGEIRIVTRLCRDAAEILITDTGSGIPEEIRERIFDPFFTTKAVGRGTGQGLAMAYSTVVEKHGGCLELESELGLGTTFIIRLPMTATETLGRGLAA